MSRNAHHAVAARLVDPKLTARLLRYVGSLGVPDGDAWEVLDVARMQVFERGLPRTAVEVDRMLFRFVHNGAMDWHRDTAGQPALEEGVVVTVRRPRTPPEPLPAPPEAKKALRQVRRLAARDPRHAQALEAIRQKEAGKSLERFAVETGVAPATIRQWIRRFRDHAREHLPRR